MNTEDYEPSSYTRDNGGNYWMRLGNEWVSPGVLIHRFELLEVRVKQLEQFITTNHTAEALKWKNPVWDECAKGLEPKSPRPQPPEH